MCGTLQCCGSTSRDRSLAVMQRNQPCAMFHKRGTALQNTYSMGALDLILKREAHSYIVRVLP